MKTNNTQSGLVLRGRTYSSSNPQPKGMMPLSFTPLGEVLDGFAWGLVHDRHVSSPMQGATKAQEIALEQAVLRRAQAARHEQALSLIG